MANSLAVLDQPKFQFNANVAMGMAGRYGFVRQRAKDHCINRQLPPHLERSWVGKLHRQYICTIGKKG